MEYVLIMNQDEVHALQSDLSLLVSHAAAEERYYEFYSEREQRLTLEINQCSEVGQLSAAHTYPALLKNVLFLNLSPFDEQHQAGNLYITYILQENSSTYFKVQNVLNDKPLIYKIRPRLSKIDSLAGQPIFGPLESSGTVVLAYKAGELSLKVSSL